MRLFTIATLLGLVASIAPFQNKPVSEIRGQTYFKYAGHFLPAIRIELNLNGEVVFRATSDDTGRYEILGVPAGIYKVSASASGFALTEMNIELRAGERKLLNIALDIGRNELPVRQSSEIKGIVRSVNQDPLADATVVFVDPYEHTVVEKASTDRAGRYSLRPLGSQFVVYASKPGFGSSAVILSLHNRQWSLAPDQVDLTLSPLPPAPR